MLRLAELQERAGNQGFRPVFAYELGWCWLPDDDHLTAFGHTSGHTLLGSSKDLEAIQKRALVEGLPYQTLISGLLHKYASGRLKEV